MRIVGGFQDTRSNNEDFAITPYLFTVYVIGKVSKIYGIGFCWGYVSIYLGTGFNLPKTFPFFRIVNKYGNSKR